MSSIQTLLIDKLKKNRFISFVSESVLNSLLKAKFFDSVNLSFVQLYLFKLYSNRQEWARAEKACLKAIKCSPENAGAYHNLAVCLIEQKLWCDALKACDQSIELDDKNPWIYHSYGRTYLGLKKYKKAVEFLQKAIEIYPNFSWFYYHLGEALFFSENYNQAVPVFEKFIDLNPSFPWAKYYLGKALLAQDRFEDMVLLYQEAHKEHPDICDFDVTIDYAVFLKMQEHRIRQYCEQYAHRQQASTSLDNSESLDILMVAPQPTYPLNSGGGIRMHYQAKALSKNHRLVLVSFIFSPEDFSIAEEMEKYCDLPIVVLMGDYLTSDDEGTPNLARLCGSHQMVKMLRMLQGINFDITCFEFISTAQYRSLFPDSFNVLGEHNIESEILRRFNQLEKEETELKSIAKKSNIAEPFSNVTKEIELLSAYEDSLWPRFQLRTVVSSQDKELLENRCHSAGKTLVVKNGIDTRKVQKIEGLEDKQKIFFFGTLNYFPNVDGSLYLVEEIMPMVWELCPDLMLCIAGRNPPQEVLALGAHPLVQVIPNPESIEELAQECSISVVPLRLGGGTRLKILHSMAMGLPNISTRLGCEGLEAEPDKHLIVKDSPEEFAQAIVNLNSNVELQKYLSHSARLLVEEKYDWENIFCQYEEQLLNEFKDWKEKSEKL